MNAYVSAPQAGWSAKLELEFKYKNTRTVLARNRHQGPLKVQRPFYPESLGQCHVYILHPPGGIVAGDSLNIHGHVWPEAHGLITTPSAGRVYCTNDQRLPQTQEVALNVEEGGFCEWLPQENIVFDNAHAISKTRVNLKPGARFIGWEITCLGRPASKAEFLSGSLLQSFEIYSDGSPMLLERNRFIGGSDLLKSKWGLQQASTVATLVCTVEDADLLKQLKTQCQEFQNQTRHPIMVMEATQLPGLLVVRALASQAEPVKNAFIAIWKALRMHLLKSEAKAPRIWYT